MNATTSGAVAEIRDRVRAAREARRSLRVVGAGTWLDAGRPVAAADTISTAALTGIVEYVPGDLTLTARAGATLAELRDATAQHDQWLTLDPWGGDAGTIGATIATATAGPLSTGFGTPRDALLGFELVTGRGAVVRGGGRVVKNVAGFDIPRLVTGSWGTLGVITEVTIRLRGQPPEDDTMALTGLGDAGRLRAGLAELPFSPVAAEYVSAGLAEQHGFGAEEALIVRLSGNEQAVAAERTAMRGFGEVRRAQDDFWGRLRGSEPAASAVWRLSTLPAKVDEAISVAREAVALCPGAFWHASLLRGVVRCIVPNTAPRDAVAAALALPFKGTRICERLPSDLWPRIPPATTGRLSNGIKHAFDPDGVLNPGILGPAA